MSYQIARIQDKHYSPVLTVDVCEGVSEVEDGVILTICDNGELADKNPKDSGDAGSLRTLGLSFEAARELAKALNGVQKVKGAY